MVDILAIGAHPDDIELGCGGLLVKASSEGQSIALCDLTVGEKGSAGTPAIRTQEALNAAKLLDADRTLLDFPDCQVTDSYEGRLELVRVIRHYKPKLVLAPRSCGTMTHPDHLACGALVRAACRYARFANILPDLPIHRPQGVLHVPMSHERPDFIIDVTPHIPKWRALIECHASQVAAHPYVVRTFTDAQNLGLLIGTEYAQGLLKYNPVRIDNPLQVARGTVEL